VGDAWHVPERDEDGRGLTLPASLAPGLYVEDEAAYQALLADPSVEHVTVERGGRSPLLHGLQVRIATPEQAALLRAMPVEEIRAGAEAYLRRMTDLGREFERQAAAREPMHRRPSGIPRFARPTMTSTLAPAEFAEGLPTGPNRARRRRDAARSRRGA
jgi:hypothetical protein